ncbi:hypothetical protein M427DRAFT_51672 [Gonapodya prolifera JEL478]|uniref:Zn(2)-C6 fungal-type domain-containing protein n=1 Tax=Gonapodya prolifera (strain JEL478) TaxID=1344416 RepID=A0A139AVG4_GONPJ|nr:hypothetical protein M427DRAFT_51672 [Gonapodya prolifera JEL478]|eukprot:KXS20689.1 hypothetical protein M427DRAFT_51672 [Gonapodya prolifera JEL478]
MENTYTGGGAERSGKRKRGSKACDTCSRRKVRCEGGQPCINCRQNGVECTWEKSSLKRGPKKGQPSPFFRKLKRLEELVVASLNANSSLAESASLTLPRDGSTLSGSDLDRILAFLETSAPDTTLPEHGPDIAIDPGMNIYIPELLGTFASPGPNFPLLEKELHNSFFFPDTIAWSPVGLSRLQDGGRALFGLVPVAPEEAVRDFDFHQEGEQEADDPEASQRITPDASSSGWTETDQRTSPSNPSPSLEEDPSERKGITGLPERLEHLLLFNYLKYVASQIPILHAQTVVRDYIARHLERVLLLCMFAPSATYATGSGINPEDVFEMARAEFNARLEEGPSLVLMQCLLLIILYTATATSRGERAWMYTGMAVRMAYELDLNVDPDDLANGTYLNSAPIILSAYSTRAATIQSSKLWSWIDKETRRRVWWSVYILDKQGALISSRGSMIQESEIRTRLPCLQILWEAVAQHIPGQGQSSVVLGASVADVLMLAETRLPDLQGWPECAVTDEIRMSWEDVLHHMPEPMAARLKVDDFDGPGLNADVTPSLGWSRLSHDIRLTLDRSRPGKVSFPEKSDPFGWLIILENIFGMVGEFHSYCLAKAIDVFRQPTTVEEQAAVARLRHLDQTFSDWQQSLPAWSLRFTEGFTGALIGNTSAVARISPSRVQTLESRSFFFLYLQILFRAACIALHRPPDIVTMARNEYWIQSESFVAACVHADEMSKIVELAMVHDENLDFFAPFGGFCIFQSAVVQLVRLKVLGISSFPSTLPLGLIQQTSWRVQVTTRALEVMGKRWKNAKMLAGLVESLSKTFIQMSSKTH